MWTKPGPGRTPKTASKEEFEIAKQNGIPARTVRYRLKKGYTVEQAISMKQYQRREDRF